VSKLTYYIVLFCIAFISFASHLTEPLFNPPKHWPKPVYNFTANPLSADKVTLGRMLFYDPILSKNNTIACANCHSPFNAFTHVDHALSHGIDDRVGTRNSPTLMNLAWHKEFMWDGAINHLDMQALAPISHPDEMAEEISHVTKKLQASTIYSSLFYKAFNDSMVTGEHTLKALAQFMLTLVSADAKYDRVKRSKERFTNQEQHGYILFKKHCNSCHIEPLFTNLQYENNGLKIDPTLNDIGRMKVTKLPADSLKFKVPTLRNIEFSYPYMHDGRFKNLTAVMKHYTSGIETHKTLSLKLQQPIRLSADDQVDLIAFLLTLTDKGFLFNPKFGFPKELIH
jgi:cytochrome c peroxidase